MMVATVISSLTFAIRANSSAPRRTASFAYGVMWNTVRRNLFNWKHEDAGNLEARVKGFCAVPHLLRVLKDFILFTEKPGRLG